jgi:hypothetical protein
VRACMVREHAPPLNPVCGGRCQKGGFVLHACPFLGDSCFPIKAFGVLGTVFGGHACPFLGDSCFLIKAFGILGTVFGGHACPFLGDSCFPIKWIAGFRGCRCGSFIVRLGTRSVIIALIIAVKICPRRMIRVVGWIIVVIFLPSGDAVRYVECELSAKAEHHGCSPVCSCKHIDDVDPAAQVRDPFFLPDESGRSFNGQGGDAGAGRFQFCATGGARVFLSQRRQQARRAELVPACCNSNVLGSGSGNLQTDGAHVCVFFFCLCCFFRVRVVRWWLMP